MKGVDRMIDLNKEIVFRDGWTLEREEDLTDDVLNNTSHVRALGKHFGLSLDEFEIFSDLIYFEWRGTKRNLLKFYTYVSKNMTSESPEKRKATQLIILNK